MEVQGVLKDAGRLFVTDEEGLFVGTMNLSLPDYLEAWVEAQARSGRYPNVGDYVCDLIRRDQERGEKIAAMQKLVDEGLASGEARPFDAEAFLARMRSGQSGTNGG